MGAMVTAIDAGHWLAVLIVMGAIIGAFWSLDEKLKYQRAVRRMIVACLAAVHNVSGLRNA
jgi:hypothetical protein